MTMHDRTAIFEYAKAVTGQVQHQIEASRSLRQDTDHRMALTDELMDRAQDLLISVATKT